MHSKRDNIEIMMNYKADEIIEELFVHLKIYIKIIYNRWKVVSLSSIMLNYCTINVIKYIPIVVDHI